jgi:signal peptidase I
MFIFSPKQGRWQRAGFVVALVVVGLWCGGCSTVPKLSQNEFFVRTAPVPTLVAPGQELVVAERAAAEDERCFALVGAGRSMEPLYASGTAIVVREQNFRTLRAGMAVVYRNRANRYVAHLLVEELAAGWIASGLNNPAPDPELVTAHNFVGVVQAAYAAADTKFRAEIAAELASKHGVDRRAQWVVVRD